MATRVTITPLSNDPNAPIRVAKVKLANDRGDREAEAAWLQRAARPGVVPLVSTTEATPDGAFTIVTEHVGSRTLRTARLEPFDGWRAVVDVATLVADLHSDGLVHGKLTVDHVIIGAERVWLCSPDGTCEDPAADLDGLARCLRDLRRQWEADGRADPFGNEWAEVADRLADTTDPSRSATRALHALRRLDPHRDPDTTRTDSLRTDRTLRPAHRRTGILAAFLASVAAIAALPLVADGDRRPPTTVPRIEIDGAVYAVGNDGDDVVVLDRPCDPSTPVVVLEAGTQTIWAFDRIADGATARRVAVVPGATDVRAEWIDGDRPCTVVVARGPAGASIIETTP